MTHVVVQSILGGVENFRRKHPELLTPKSRTEVPVTTLLSALEQFRDLVRYLNTRRSKTALSLDNEASVQDALYLMLRPWILDLVYETPTDRIANSFAIKDFRSKSLRTVIEAKFIRNKDHGKSIIKELNDDIETYRYDDFCDHLIFFIFDPDGHIPDGEALKAHVCQRRSYGDKVLSCYCVVKP